MKKNLLLILTTCALLTSCDAELKVKKREKSLLTEMVLALEYHKDTRTGLCFGYTVTGQLMGTDRAEYHMLVNVPCENVEKFLK